MVGSAGRTGGDTGARGEVGSVRSIRLSCWFSLQKSRRALASDAWAAACSPEVFLPKPPRRLKDSDGESIEEVRRKAGIGGELDEVKLPDGYYKAFVELHIEQGPVLERQQIPLGVVTSIAAPASMRIVDRRRGWTRRRSPDAGSPRRAVRGRGVDSGN